MYAIQNTRTKKWLYGTDYTQSYNGVFRQRTSGNQAVTWNDEEQARLDMKFRRCGKDYEVKKVNLTISEG